MERPLYRSLIFAVLTCISIACGASELNDVYRRAVQAPGRSEADRERDLRESPEAFLAFAGYKPGMRIADIFGGGGYYAELLSRVVGARGQVLLLNNPFYETSTEALLSAHLKGGRLKNVVHTTIDPADLKLRTASLDSVLLVMAFHDLYFEDAAQGWPAIDASHFIDQVVSALKPGGTLLIIDHAARPGSGASAVPTLHRIDENFTRHTLTEHGLAFESAWDGLRNPADDHSRRVFDPLIRGRTDRFVHRYRKPGG